MISIRWRLTVLLGLGVGTLVVTCGVGVFVAMQQLLRARFDETLTAKARALITASEIDDGEFEIDLTVQDFAGFGRGGEDYFEIRRMDGTVFLSSPSLAFADNESRMRGIGAHGVPEDDDPRIRDGVLGDGRAARLYVQRFYPKDDFDSRFRDLYYVVASPTRRMSRDLAMLATVLGVAGATALLLTISVIRIGLGRGLRPLDRLAADLGRIRPESLHERLDVAALPAELVPVADRLNEWLGRLEASFDRERRFSSHAAHELRTPLAELKSMAELGAAWPDEATPERCAEMVTVTNELESLLEKLSLLARADAGRQPIQRVVVDLPSSLHGAIARFEAAAGERRLRFDCNVPDGQLVTDPVLWNAIVQNLLGNAVAYAPKGSRIGIDASPRALAVTNQAPELDRDDLESLFERFWRKDEARTDHAHSGLGLSIVRACAKLLGGRCSATLSADAELRVEVRWTPAG